MKGKLVLNKEYKTGIQVLSTDWHAGHYFHTLVKDIIKFDENNMFWYQEVVLDAGGGYGQYAENISQAVFIGKYKIDLIDSMINCSLTYNNIRKDANGSFSINDKNIILDIATFYNGQMHEKRPYCFTLTE